MKYGDKTRHGMSASPEFYVWQSMIARCMNPNHENYGRYGGRGIGVCARWQRSFRSFLDDMGARPSSGHSIDREDNDGDYTPKNCRWALSPVQNANKSTNVVIAFGGQRKTMAEWARSLRISRQALRFRLGSDDWSLTDALTIGEHRVVRGERHKLAKVSDVQAREIVRRRLAGERLAVLSHEFGISASRVSKMTRKRKAK